MALVAADFHEAHLRRHGIQGVGDALVLHRREQPVAGEGHDAEARRVQVEDIRQMAAMVRRQVEIIHGAGDVEVGVGVEPVHEAGALVVQVGFDLEVRRELEGHGFAVLQVATELALQCHL